MGDWRNVGDQLVDTFLTGEEEDIKELSVLIRERIGCHKCKVQELCRDYKDECFDGECWRVLESFFADMEDEDTEEERERRRKEAREQEEEDWRSWTYRD